jgi:hypothetical protein
MPLGERYPRGISYLVDEGEGAGIRTLNLGLNGSLLATGVEVERVPVADGVQERA